MAHYQDWQPVVIRKRPQSASESRDPKAVTQARRQGWEVATAEKKLPHATHPNHHRDALAPSSAAARKLEEESENFRHERVKGAVRRAIAQARQTRKMTQAQLAHAMSVKPQVVQDYESGRAIPNGQTLAHMSRILGVNLREVSQKEG